MFKDDFLLIFTLKFSKLLPNTFQQIYNHLIFYIRNQLQSLHKLHPHDYYLIIFFLFIMIHLDIFQHFYNHLLLNTKLLIYKQYHPHLYYYYLIMFFVLRQILPNILLIILNHIINNINHLTFLGISKLFHFNSHIILSIFLKFLLSILESPINYQFLCKLYSNYLMKL